MVERDFKRQKVCDVETNAAAGATAAPGPEHDLSSTTLPIQAIYGVLVGKATVAYTRDWAPWRGQKNVPHDLSNQCPRRSDRDNTYDDA
jgi:hypothetical protein